MNEIAGDVKHEAAFDLDAALRKASSDSDIEIVVGMAVLAERERCAKVCEAQKVAFLSPEYASNQPLGSMLERFACDECASAIRSGESP